MVMRSWLDVVWSLDAGMGSRRLMHCWRDSCLVEGGRLRYPAQSEHNALFILFSLGTCICCVHVDILGRFSPFFSRHCNAELAEFVILAESWIAVVLLTWGSKIPLSVMVSKYEQEAQGRSYPFVFVRRLSHPVSKTSKCRYRFT